MEETPIKTLSKRYRKRFGHIFGVLLWPCGLISNPFWLWVLNYYMAGRNVIDVDIDCRRACCRQRVQPHDHTYLLAHTWIIVFSDRFRLDFDRFFIFDLNSNTMNSVLRSFEFGIPYESIAKMKRYRFFWSNFGYWARDSVTLEFWKISNIFVVQ